MQINQLDISPLFDGEASTSSEEVDRNLVAALRRDGAVSVHGFPDHAALPDQVRELLSVFDLPLDAKLPMALREYQPGNRNLYRGYTPLPTKPHWAYHEGFDIGPGRPGEVPDCVAAAAFQESNIWPEEADLPGWRRAMLAFVADRRALTLVVAASVARGLGIDPARMLVPFAGANHTFRLLHYPPMPDGFALKGPDGEPMANITDDGMVPPIAREHIDLGLFSVLWQDQSGGLQMQGRDGVWRDVVPRPDALSIHCGDLLAGLTGGALVATPHRVLGGRGERCSLGYFLEPEFTTVVETSSGDRKTYAQHLIDAFPTRFLPPEDHAA